MSSVTSPAHVTNVTPAAFPAVHQAEPAVEAMTPGGDEEILLTPPPKQIVKTWKDRGDFFLSRKEADPAIEAYTKALQAAEEAKDTLQTGRCLKNLGQAFLEKGKWMLAAKLFNGAFALLPDEGERRTLLPLMAEVERRFLEKECDIKAKNIFDSQAYLKAREQLEAIRNVVRKGVEKKLPAEQILATFSQHIGLFVEGLLKEIYPVLGKLPCEFAIIALGSMARKEMSPYSDLEFAILVSKYTKKTQAYFQRLARLLEIKVIHLGETEIKILLRGRESPTAKGFSFDDGGNTPLGKAGYVELINTPQGMAKFQTKRFYEEDLILSNVLKGSAVVLGKTQLFDDYIKAMQEILESREPSSTLSLGQSRALHLMAGHLVEFEPQIDARKEENPLFNIKAELYRLPSFIIGSLSDFFGIPEQNSWERLNQLRDKKILNEEAVERIKTALNAIMRLRIRSHLHYRCECEEAYHPAIRRKNAEIIAKARNAFTLSQDDIEQIIEIYRVLFPMHRVFAQFSSTHDLELLKQANFYDNSFLADGLAYIRLCDYEKAKEKLQKAVRLHPDDAEAQLQLSNMLWRTAEYAEAKEHGSVALTLAIEKRDELLQLRAHSNMGLLYKELGDHRSALGEHKQALKIAEKNYFRSHPSRGLALNNIGLAWKNLGKPKKAVKYFRKAYKNSKEFYGRRHSTAALTLCNLAGATLSSGEPKRALSYFKKAWKVVRHNAQEEQIIAAQFRNNLGDIYWTLGEHRKAIHHFEIALALNLKLFGYEHPNTSKYLGNLALAQLAQGATEKVIPQLEEALRIGRACLGAEHPDVVSMLNNLGIGCHALGLNENAIAYYEQALALSQKVQGDAHPLTLKVACSLARSLADAGQSQKGLEISLKAVGRYREDPEADPLDLALGLNHLGAAYQGQKNYAKALDCFQEALKIYQKAFGDLHPQISTTLSNAGAALQALERHEEALATYKEAVRIAREVYGEGHPQIAACLLNISGPHYALGQMQQCRECSEEAMKINAKAKGPECSEVAHSLHNLAMTYKREGNLAKALELSDRACEILKKCSYQPLNLALKALEDNCLLLQTPENAARAVDALEQLLKLQQKAYGSEHASMAATFSNLALAYKNMSNYSKALEYNLQALAIVRRVHGDQHLELALSLKNVAYNCEQLGKNQEARTHYDESAAIYKKIQGPACPAVAHILITLAALWRKESDFIKAAACLEEAISVLIATSGEESEVVAANINNLASDLKSQGKLQEAHEHYQRSLAINQKVLGATHQKVAASYGNLGNCCKQQKLFDKALEYVQEDLRILKLQEPQDPKEISAVLAYLITLCKECKWARKAAEYCEEAIAVQRQIHGDSHTSIANLLYDQSMLWVDANEGAMAIESARRSYDMFKVLLGDKHPGLLKVLEQLGKAYQKAGQLDQVFENGEEQLRFIRSVGGVEHEAYIPRLIILGKLWLTLKDLPRVKHYFDQAIQTRTMQVGALHVKTAEIHKAVGQAYLAGKESDLGLAALKEALRVYQQLSEDTRNMQFSILFKLGETYYERDDYANALSYISKAVELKKQLKPKGDYETAVLLAYLGIIHSGRGQIKKAIAYFQEKQPLIVKDRSEMLTHMQWMCQFLLNAGEFARCEAALNETQAMSQNNVHLTEIHRMRSQMLLQQEKYPEALDCSQRAIELIANETSDDAARLRSNLSRNLCLIYMQQDNFQMAHVHLDKMLSYYASSQMRSTSYYNAQLTRAELIVREGKPQIALEICRTIQEFLNRCGIDQSLLAGRTWCLIAKAHLALGAFEEASDALKQASAILHQLNESDQHPDIAQTLQVLAELKAKQGFSEESARLLQQAKEMIANLSKSSA